MEFLKTENQTGATDPQGQSSTDTGPRKRPAAVRSTGGKAPRKQLSEKQAKINEEQAKMKRYEHRLRHGRRVEMETQTPFKSESDVQIQTAPETKETAVQTDYNHRFYMDYSGEESQG